MPSWIGKWKGGRFYSDDEGRPVYVIEAMRGGHRYALKLDTHDEELAVGEFTRFLADPVAFAAPPPRAPTRVEISKERVALYLASIRHTVADHRNARVAQLGGWAKHGLDLRTVDRATLRKVLGSFTGGHRGRVEALNAFARFLVKEGELPSWAPLSNHVDPRATRADREAYSLEQLRAAFLAIDDQRTRDLFYLRAATGMHHTEIAQLEGAPVLTGPLPDKGVAIRRLPKGHEIAGVLQVLHKSRRRHRQAVDAAGLASALRLRDGVPDRVSTWKALEPLGVVPSNLRHTFVTLAGEVGEIVTYSSAGVERSRIAQAVGHRAGSTITADRYDKLQVPPMIRLPLGFQVSKSRKSSRVKT